MIVALQGSSAKDIFDSSWNARTGVEEYGGGSAIVYDGVVYFSNYDNGRVYAVNGVGSTPIPVTPGKFLQITLPKSHHPYFSTPFQITRTTATQIS